MGINKINLVGRLGKDPEFRYIDKNTAIARLRLAVNNYDYDSNGNNNKVYHMGECRSMESFSFRCKKWL